MLFNLDYEFNTAKDEFWVKDAPSSAVLPLITQSSTHIVDALSISAGFKTQVVFVFDDYSILPLGQMDWSLSAAVNSTFTDDNGNNREDAGERRFNVSADSKVKTDAGFIKTANPLPRLIPPLATDAITRRRVR